MEKIDQIVVWLIVGYGLIFALMVYAVYLLIRKKNKTWGILLLILSFTLLSIGVTATALGGIWAVCSPMYRY